MLASSRKLGEAVDASRYADLGMIELETHFNAMNPFWQAPIAYGAALCSCSRLALGFVSRQRTRDGDGWDRESTWRG